MVNLLIILYSALNGIDPALSFQIAKIESNMNPLAVSKTDDGGLFQLNRKYFKFHNPNLIFDPTLNISIALNYLRFLKRKCKYKDNNTYVLCYNLGLNGASKINFPYKHSYYRKMNILRR